MLAFWMGGASAPGQAGAGILIFSKFEIDGTGTFLAWFRPSSAILEFPKFRLRGVGEFFIPIAEESPCIPCINRQILVITYGWGVLDLSTQFSFDPCGLGEDEPPLIVSSSEPILTAQDIELDRLRAERARDNAIARQITRDSDPSYIVPTTIPAPVLQKPMPIERIPFEISVTGIITLKVAGTIRTLPISEEIPEPELIIATKPQPVTKKEIEPAKATPSIAHAPFEVTPVKAKQSPAPGKIAPLKVPETPQETPEKVAPPRPVVKPEPKPEEQTPDVRHHTPMVRNPKKRR